MSVRDTISIQVSDGASTISQSMNISADGRARYSGTIAQNTVDQEVDLSFKFAAVKCFIISSDQDIQIETNAVDATGGDTLTPKAGTPIIWYLNCGYANPFTANVTKMYITVGAVGAAGANIEIDVVHDATP